MPAELLFWRRGLADGLWAGLVLANVLGGPGGGGADSMCLHSWPRVKVEAND